MIMNIFNNKKRKLVGSILILMIMGVFALGALSGCSDNKSGTKTDNSKKADIKVLSLFPKEFLPLHEALRVNNCSYEVKEPANWVFGKDAYMVEFESSASMDELAKYYKGQLDKVYEEDSFSEYVFEGIKGEQRVSINISEEGFLDALGTTVTISFGVPKAEYAETNKYFGDYPKELIDMAFVSQSVRYNYREDYYYKLKKYSIGYITTEKPETIKEHYKNLYGTKDGYKEVTDQYGTTFSWNEGEYKCVVYHGDSTGTDTLLLTVEKEL